MSDAGACIIYSCFLPNRLLTPEEGGLHVEKNRCAKICNVQIYGTKIQDRKDTKIDNVV